jgi:flagellar hook assembly protein FlgD
MITPVTSTAQDAVATSAGTSEAAASGAPAEVSKDAFLRLLVAQLQHHAEFVSQLAGFTQLEQTIGIRQELEMIRQALAANAGKPADPAPEEGGSEAPAAVTGS